jgi:hypothetical protein
MRTFIKRGCCRVRYSIQVSRYFLITVGSSRQSLTALLYLLHLTSKDGGNAKGLSGTTLAL